MSQFAPSAKAGRRSPARGAAAALPSGISERQRRVAAARLALVREVERLAPIVGKESAVMNVLSAAQEGALPVAAQAVIGSANACGKGGIAISRRSLYRWHADYVQGGEASLTPGVRGRDPAPDWGALFLTHYQQPQHPPVTLAYKTFYRDALLRGVSEDAIPSIHACRRLLKRMSVPEREAGRDTGNALLRLRPYKRRSTTELWPTDVYTADGTTFDAEIQHPYNGQPWKPELTAVIDVATRRCVGLSIALAENALTVLDALRMACCFGGIPALFYADNGPGYVNALLRDDATGMFPRLGIEFTAAIPGRPQGKGLMERGVKTLWVEAAQGLATYTGALMDGDAAHANFKLTRAHIKAGKGGGKALLPTWEAFKAHVLARVEEYNATPHDGLPRFVDAAGRRRHYAPDEYWRTFVARGFQPVAVADDVKDELFMPAERRKARNGWIEFYSGRYYAPELAAFHGDVVEVRYDIWDAAKIRVWTLDGRKICTASLDGNTLPYFPQSRVEAAREKREQAQVRRLDARLQRVAPGAEIVLPDDRLELADSTAPRALDAAPTVEPPPAEGPADDARPTLFLSTFARYGWLMRHPDARTEQDREWLAAYAAGEEYADMADLYAVQGIAYKENL